jgi:hypothetical protein
MRIYCGTDDYLSFFAKIVEDLKLDIDYTAILADGEWEIEIKERGEN